MLRCGAQSDQHDPAEEGDQPTPGAKNIMQESLPLLLHFHIHNSTRFSRAMMMVFDGRIIPCRHESTVE